MVSISTVLVAQNLIERGYPFVESIASVAPFSEEIIVVEGHSSDDTMEWLERLQDLFPQLRIIQAKFRKNSHWLANMRNVGIEACNGEYIWGGDIDEVIPEGSEEYIYTAIRKFPDCAAFLFPHLHFIYNFRTIRANPGYVFGHHLFKNDGRVRSIGRGTWKGNPKNQICLEAPVIFHYGDVFQQASRKKPAKQKQVDSALDIKTDCNDQLQTLPYDGPHPAIIEQLIERLNGRDYEPSLEELVHNQKV